MKRLIILLVLVLLLGSCAPAAITGAAAPRAKGGVLDLSRWDFAKQGPVVLGGQWEFQWGIYADPAAPSVPGGHLINTPGVWNGHRVNEKGLPAHGFATYRLKVTVPDTEKSLSLKMPTVSTACRLFVNGREVFHAGTAGRDADSTVPAYAPGVVDLPVSGGPIDIVLHVANFHYRKGGLWHGILLGLEEDIRAIYEGNVFMDMFVTGCLIIMGLYHLVIFAMRRKDRSPLYFGIMCLLFALRNASTGEYLIVRAMPSIPFELVIKMEYLSMFFSVMAFALFWYSLFREEIAAFAYKTLVIISLLVSAATIVTPASIYTYIMQPYQAVVLLCTIYCCYALLKSYIHKREGALIFLAGFIIVALAGINDILYANHFIETGNLLPFGFLLFIFSQAFLLSRRFANAFTNIEGLSEEISRKNAALSRLDVMKDEFLANTSHELKTPLNGIIGLADSLLDGAAGSLNQLQAENLRMIAASGKRLAALVNDILDFSKLKNREIALRLRPVDLWQLAEIVLAMSRPLVAGKNIVLANNIPRDLPMAYADEDRILQVFHNLVGNAVKFTRSGGITLAAAVNKGGAGEKDYALLSVSDTGIGISGDKLTDIFKTFEQADGSIEREFGGSGLGLAISKSLVELHGGNIWAESTPGHGATFYLTLPLFDVAKDLVTAPAETEPYPERGDERAKASLLARDDRSCLLDYYRRRERSENSYRVMAVDDDPVNLQVVINFLKTYQYDVIPALSGMEALQLLEEAKPDLVLLDVMMPKMGGYETAWKIRDRYPCEELPIIFLTAKHHPRDLVDGFFSGGNDYIAKPFSKEELLTRIDFQIALKEAIRESKSMAVMEQELETARRMQLSAGMISVPRSPRFEIAARHLPSKRIGGDYCDLDISDKGTLTAFMADVSGSGIPAAFITSMVKIILDLQKKDRPDPAGVLRGMNDSLYGHIEYYFITAIAVAIDPDAGRLLLARAGHLPLMVRRGKDGQLEKYQPAGKAIGLLANEGYELAGVPVLPGDRIILLTDGITDVRKARGNDSRAMYGEMRLDDFIREHSGDTPQGFIDSLMRELKQWNGESESFLDDITIAVIDIK